MEEFDYNMDYKKGQVEHCSRRHITTIQQEASPINPTDKEADEDNHDTTK